MSGTAADIRTDWNDEWLIGDWALEPPALGSGLALQTSVLISLFSDRLADRDEPLPDNSGNRRGWWADTDAARGAIGSRLWLLVREKQTNETRLRAEDYATEALQWLIDDEVADRVEVVATWLRLGWLELDIQIYREERRLFAGKFDWAWEQLRPPLAIEREPQGQWVVWDRGGTRWDVAVGGFDETRWPS